MELTADARRYEPGRDVQRRRRLVADRPLWLRQRPGGRVGRLRAGGRPPAAPGGGGAGGRRGRGGGPAPAGDGSGAGTWKRFVARDNGEAAALGPRLVVIWSGLRPTGVSPAGSTT